MKKLLSTILTICMLISVCDINVYAEYYEEPEVLPEGFEGLYLDYIEDKEYTGDEIIPSYLTVSEIINGEVDTGFCLMEKYYEVHLVDNKEIGTAKCWVEGLRQYEGYKSNVVTFKIAKRVEYAKEETTISAYSEYYSEKLLKKQSYGKIKNLKCVSHPNSKYLKIKNNKNYYQIIFERFDKYVFEYQVETDYYIDNVESTIYFTPCAKPISLKALKKGRLKIDLWEAHCYNNNKNVGFRIQVSTDKKFKKNVKTYYTKCNKDYIIVSKLKKNKRYYVKVMTFLKLKNGKRIYEASKETASIKVK